MLSVYGYKAKKDLKLSVGKHFQYVETSMFGPEFRAGETCAVVGPAPDSRKWYAQVTTDSDGKIVKVS